MQDDAAFRRTKEIPFSVGTVQGLDIVPIFGAEVNYKIELNNSVYLKINNLLTQVITNHTIIIGMEF